MSLRLYYLYHYGSWWCVIRISRCIIGSPDICG
nr:MAG TPA: glycosyltransferase [Caudoviricetes sp.]